MNFTSNYPCPECGQSHAIEDGDLLRCLHCGHEWDLWDDAFLEVYEYDDDNEDEDEEE